jgi:hypothetical protein
MMSSNSYHGEVTLGDDTTYNIQDQGNVSLPLGEHSCKLTHILYVSRPKEKYY